MQFYYEDMNHNDAICDIERHGNLVIATELANNTGASVTNSCERIAVKCCEEFNIKGNELIFIERYDYRSSAYKIRESISVVTFEKNFSSPEWKTLTEKELDILINQQS